MTSHNKELEGHAEAEFQDFFEAISFNAVDYIGWNSPKSDYKIKDIESLLRYWYGDKLADDYAGYMLDYQI